jgi:hypothetical protein
LIHLISRRYSGIAQYRHYFDGVFPGARTAVALETYWHGDGWKSPGTENGAMDTFP